MFEYLVVSDCGTKHMSYYNDLRSALDAAKLKAMENDDNVAVYRINQLISFNEHGDPTNPGQVSVLEVLED